MNIKIEGFKAGEEHEVSSLVRKIYDEFIGIEYSEEGDQVFYDFIDPENFSKRQKDRSISFTAKHKNQIIGIIEVRDGHHVALLFVDKSHQGKGIARKLLEASIKVCKDLDHTLVNFSVNSSPFAIPIYKKLGFKAMGEMREEHGIQYVPMELKLDTYKLL